MADLAAADSAEKAFRPIRAGTRERVGLLMVDLPQGEIGLQITPRAGLVGIDRRALCDPPADEAQSILFTFEDGRHNMAIALSDNNHALPLPVLDLAAIAAVLFQIRRLDVAAEIGAVDLGFSAGAADPSAVHLDRHRFAQLVPEYKGALIVDAEIAGEGQGAFPLHLIAEDQDGGEVDLQRQFMRGEQCARGQREVGRAGFAAESQGSVRTAAFIGADRAAFGADRLSIGRRPAASFEEHFRVGVGHPQNRG